MMILGIAHGCAMHKRYFFWGRVLIKRDDVGHFKIVSNVLGVDTKGTVIKGRDHLFAFELLVYRCNSAPIKWVRFGISERIKRIVVDLFPFAFFFTKIPIQTLLCAVGHCVPSSQTERIEVAKFITRSKQVPNQWERVSFGNYVF